VGYVLFMFREKESALPWVRRCSVIAGPTGSGKSELAISWARKSGAEIVCVDSMTLYRGFDLGTAKPGPAIRAEIPHHLLDLLDPGEDASAGWWFDLARQTIQSILGEGKKAILVGGTALYFQLLFHGMAQAPPRSDVIRRRLEEEALAEGPLEFHKRLAEKDPTAAKRIHPNDSRRLVRALEVLELTGETITKFQAQWGREVPEGPEGDERWVWLAWPRNLLRERIALRNREMIQGGWMEEVRDLKARYGEWGKTASQAVGYCQLMDVVHGKLSLPEAERKIIEGTCQVAKRQETWFRSMSMLTPLICPMGQEGG
jgi:tRNA dimethylallyltransferase